MKNNNLNIKNTMFFNLIMTLFVSMYSYSLWVNMSLFSVFMMNNIWMVFLMMWMMLSLMVEFMNINEQFLFMMLFLWSMANYFILYLMYNLTKKYNKWMFIMLNFIFLFLNLAIWMWVHY